MANTFMSKLIRIRKYLLKIKSIMAASPRWLLKALLFIRRAREGYSKAFTFFEAVIVLAALGTLLAVSIPIYTNVLNKARIVTAITDIAAMAREIEDYLEENGDVPDTLNEIRTDFKDPWGRPYEYLAVLNRNKHDIEGKWRKDRFQVPLNTDFDLYSKGKDGDSAAALTASKSYDDIVRANNGDYIGPASKY
jgi:general secretion pathway protein G